MAITSTSVSLGATDHFVDRHLGSGPRHIQDMLDVLGLDSVDQLIDVIEGNRAYIPVLYVFNKIDSLFIEELDILDRLENVVPISSAHKWNLEELMEEIWNRCNMIRIYTKPKGQIPDYEEPVILHATNPTIEEFCNRLHKGLLADFSHAWVWGRSAKHQPQRCGKDHVLCDEDIVQLCKKV